MNYNGMTSMKMVKGGGGLHMYVVLPQELQKYSTHTFFFKSVEINIGVKYTNL